MKWILTGVLFILVFSAVWGVLMFLNYKFHINHEDREFILKQGVISSKKTTVPFTKIQQVYLKRSLFQRLLRVYSLKIDTAGSHENEVQIKALSKEKALELKEILMGALSEKSTPEKEDSPETKVNEQAETEKTTDDWSYRVSFLTLFKIGITSNWFRGVWILLIFVNQVYQEIESLISDSDWWKSIGGFLKEFQGIFQIIFILAIAFISVVFIGIIITLAEVFIKYSNLIIQKKQDALHVEMGLTSTTQFALKGHRLQLLRFYTNPLQKSLGLYNSNIYLSDSENNLEKTKLKLPGLEEPVVEKLQNFFYGKKAEGTGQNFQPDRVFLGRKIFLALIPVYLLWIARFVLPGFDFNLWILGVLSLLYILPAIWFQIKLFNNLNLSINDEFILKKHGVWNQKTEIIELHKLQGISMDQAIWFKKRKLENITFHTAGGDLSFPLIEHDFLKPQLNYILYSIESTKRPWM